MPLGGENVGTAYVRIIADGSDVPDGIKDSMKDAEPEMKEAGGRHSKAYQEGFDENFQADDAKWRKTLAESFNKGRGRFNAIGKNMGDDLSDGLFAEIRKRLNASFKGADSSIGDQIFKNLIGDYRKNGNLQGLLRALENLPQTVDQAVRDIQRVEDKFRADREAAYAEHNKRLVKDFDSIALAVERFTKGLEIEGKFKSGDLNDQIDRLRINMDRAGVSTFETRARLHDLNRELFLATPNLSRADNKLRDFADSVGKMSGRGARNDVINLFGAMTRGFAMIPRITTRGSMALFGFRNNARLAFDQVKDSGGSTFRALVAGAGSVTRSVTGLAGKFAGSIFGAGLLTSALSLLAGVVTALASTAIMGLIGGLGALAGAFAPLAAGIGVTILAFQNMPNEAKAAMTRVGLAFKGLGGLAGREVFGNVTEQARRFTNVVGDLEPLVHDVGQEISKVADYWLDMMSGPGFKSFQKQMTKFIPDAVGRLGRIFANTFGGLGGMLVGLIPLTKRFLGWLEGVTKNFSDWANDKAGRQEIREFFKDAGDSASRLGDFLGAVWDILGTIIQAGNEGGDTMFNSMTEAVKKWNKELIKNPDILKNFFNDAVEFGEAIGSIVLAVGKLWDTLDNKATRSAVILGFEALGNAIEAIADIVGPLLNAFAQLDDSTHGVSTKLLALTFVAPRVVSFFTGMISNVTGLKDSYVKAIDAAKKFSGVQRGLLGAAGLAGITAGFVGATQEGNTFGDVLAGTLGGAALGTAIMPGIGTLIGAGAGAGLTGLIAAFSGTKDAAKQTRAELMRTKGLAIAKQSAKNLSDALNGVARSYGKVAQAAVQATFRDEKGELIGQVKTMQALGLSMRDITNATLGRADAARLVSRTISSQLAEEEANVKRLSAEYDAGFENLQAMANTGFDLKGVKRSRDEQEDFADALDITKTKLDKATSSVENLTEAQTFMGDEIKGNTQSIKEHKQVMEELADRLGFTKEQYLALPKLVRTDLELNKFPETRTSVLQLIRDYKSLQSFKNIQAVVKASGVQLTMADVKKLDRLYGLLPKEKKTLLNVNSKAAKKAIDNIQDNLRRYNKDKHTTSLDANIKPAKDKLTELGKFIKQMPGVPKAITAMLLANVDGATKQTGKAKDRANDFVKTKYEAKLDADPSGVVKGIDAATAKIRTFLSIPATKQVTINTTYTTNGKPPLTAVGGIFNGSQVRTIGEAGPEAVVPLNRPLSQVDPAVRWLSAIAQGKGLPAGNGKTIDASGWTIVSQGPDPETVAQETLNRLLAQSF